MDDRVRAAIENNVALYRSVFRSHHLRYTTRGDLWLALDPAPAYYSSAIALTPSVRESDVVAALANVDSGGVKDSFCTLDLKPHGFSELFFATWIYRQPEKSSSRPRFEWTVVSSPADLDRYRESHGTADSILAELLSDPEVTVLIAREAETIAGGAIFNRSGTEVGVSNLFATDHLREAIWRDIPIVAATHFPDRAIVGYEHGEDLRAAIDAGFTATGPLRIWAR